MCLFHYLRHEVPPKLARSFIGFEHLASAHGGDHSAEASAVPIILILVADRGLQSANLRRSMAQSSVGLPANVCGGFDRAFLGPGEIDPARIEAPVDVVKSAFSLRHRLQRPTCTCQDSYPSKPHRLSGNPQFSRGHSSKDELCIAVAVGRGRRSPQAPTTEPAHILPEPV
jgi:hypothetical protein